MTTSARAACAAMIFCSATAMPARAADTPGITAKAAFEKLKSLAGDWESKSDGHGHHDDSSKILYRVTANGSVVMETYHPGTDFEMISMYHLDGDELKMTHYCAARNQPHMRLDKKGSTLDDLKFVFDGGTNFDPAKDMHIHSGRIIFRDKGHVDTEWEAYKDGKSLGVTKFAHSKP